MAKLVLESRRGVFGSPFRGRGVARGDGRSVLLVPGFLSGDWSLRLLHGWLERIGYRSYQSGIYVNAFHSEHMLAGLRHRMAEIRKDDDAPITLIGHSRGGLLAKVLSQRRPKDVEQVITLGSPLADVTDLALVTRAAVGVVTTANELGFGRRLRAGWQAHGRHEEARMHDGPQDFGRAHEASRYRNPRL